VTSQGSTYAACDTENDATGSGYYGVARSLLAPRCEQVDVCVMTPSTSRGVLTCEMIEKAGSPLRVGRDKVDTLFASDLQLSDCDLHAASPVCGEWREVYSPVCDGSDKTDPLASTTARLL